MKKLFTFALALIFSAASFAQVPSSGFETWQTNSGIGMTGPYTYEIPQNWELGFISSLLSGFGMQPNVGKSTTKNSGSFSLKLSSNADSVGADLMTAFSLGANARPQTFSGFFQTSGVVTDPNDFGQAIVFLTKWNGTKTDTVGMGMADLDNAPNSFKPFSANIQYLGATNPDSAIVYFLYFPEAANTHILIDDLAFTGLLGSNENITFQELAFFPNPVSGNQNATLTFHAPKAENALLSIRDVTGKEVMQIALNNLQAGKNTIEVATSQLKTGLYIATLQASGSNQVFRFIKR